MNVVEAKYALRAAANEAQQVIANKSLSTVQQKARLDQLDARVAEAKRWLDVSADAGKILAGNELIDNDGVSYGASLKAGRVPRLDLNEDVCRALFNAASTKQSLRLDISTKATTTDPGTLIPSTLLPGVVDLRREPVRLLDYIPASPMAGPSVEMIQHVSTTGVATVVARGTAKPALVLNTQALILVARKLAATTGCPDELLHDYAGWVSYLQNELTRAIVSAENSEVLSGDSTGEHLNGLLLTAGILTRDAAADVVADATATGLDTIEMAISDLRSGASFVEPDAIVLSPSTWSKLRRTKDSQHRPLVNTDPTAAEADSLYGIKVLVTTSMAVGTALVASLSQGVTAFVRTGMTLEASNSQGTNFVDNITTFRAEERLCVGVPRPSALLKVVNL